MSDGPLSRTQVSQCQKKTIHSLSIFVGIMQFSYLPQSIASSLFSCPVGQSFSTTSLQVSSGLSLSCILYFVIHDFFRQLFSSFLETCPYYINRFRHSTVIISCAPSLSQLITCEPIRDFNAT